MFDWLKPKPEMSDFDRQLLSSNIVGAKTLSELDERERMITTQKTRELKDNPIQGNLDYEYLKKIHKYLFKDVYVWAGMDRYDIGIRGDFRKGDTHFTPGNKLPEVSKILFEALQKENHFKDLKKDDFVKSVASFMNGLNMLHPFREGNGRTQRIFIEQLADNAGYHLDLSKVSKNIMIQASIQAEKGNTKGFEIIIGDNIKEKNIKKEPQIDILDEWSIIDIDGRDITKTKEKKETKKSNQELLDRDLSPEERAKKQKEFNEKLKKIKEDSKEKKIEKSNIKTPGI